MGMVAAGCIVCAHPKRRDVDRRLVEDRAPGRAIAAELGCSEATVRRHRNNHLAVRIAEAAAKRDEEDATAARSIVDRIEALGAATEQAAYAALSLAAPTAAGLVREARETLYRAADMRGEVTPQPVEQGRAAVLELVDGIRARRSDREAA